MDLTIKHFNYLNQTLYNINKANDVQSEQRVDLAALRP